MAGCVSLDAANPVATTLSLPVVGWAQRSHEWEPAAYCSVGKESFQFLSIAANVSTLQHAIGASDFFAPGPSGSLQLLQAGTVSGSASMHAIGRTPQEPAQTVIVGSSLELPNVRDTACGSPTSACGVCLDGFTVADCGGSCNQGAAKAIIRARGAAGSLVTLAAVPAQFEGVRPFGIVMLSFTAECDLRQIESMRQQQQHQRLSAGTSGGYSSARSPPEHAGQSALQSSIGSAAGGTLASVAACSRLPWDGVRLGDADNGDANHGQRPGEDQQRLGGQLGGCRVVRAAQAGADLELQSTGCFLGAASSSAPFVYRYHTAHNPVTGLPCGSCHGPRLTRTRTRACSHLALLPRSLMPLV